MTPYFVDSVHWIALANPNDQWHKDAVRIASSTKDASLVTTEEVLIELLNFYAEAASSCGERSLISLARSLSIRELRSFPEQKHRFWKLWNSTSPASIKATV